MSLPPINITMVKQDNSGESSMQLNDQMEVERQTSPQSSIEERTHTPQSTTQETHSMVIEPREEKILIITDQRAAMKESSSPINTVVNSPKPQEPSEMRGIVLISDNHVVQTQVSKDGHLMPPSPAHTPQPVPTTVTPENEHGVRALVVYNEKGEVQDPIIQYVPNPPRDDSNMVRDESYPITCGTNKGELYWQKFICPGINAKCVKCNGVWLTPKEFVLNSGKATLKDWKRAIRINGTMLRKKIESGEIDYYQHETNCSNQCRSNKGPSLESTASQGSFNHSFEITETSSKEHSMEMSSMERSNSEENPAYHSTKRAPMLTVQKFPDSLKGGAGSLERSSSEDSGLAPSPQLDGVIMRESIATAERIQDLQAFWSGIIRSDLFDEVVKEIYSNLTAIQHRAKTSPVVSPDDAVTLTNLANSLELVPGILQKTVSQKQSVERQAEQTTHIIQDLERKLAEQKKYDNDLKRKSQVLESVMKLSSAEKRKRPKMFRRQQAVDRPTSVHQQPGPSSQAVTVSRIPPELTTVMSSPLMRYPQELWSQTGTVAAHVLQNHIPSHLNLPLPIPPHILQQTPDPTRFQVHQEASKK